MESRAQEKNLFSRLRYKGLILPLLFALILPSVCSLILGYEWIGQQANHVPAAIVDHDNSSISRTLIGYIENNQAFDVKYYSDKDSDVRQLLDESKIAVGIIIPENFKHDILNGNDSKVLVIYDGTQMSMVGAVKIRINEIMGTIRTGFLLQIMEGKLEMPPAEAERLIQPVAYSVRLLGNPAKSSALFTLQGLIMSVCQVSIYFLGVEVGDLIRRRSNKGYHYIAGILFCGITGVISASASMLIQLKLFQSPFNGSILTALILTALNMTLVAGLGVLMILLSKSKIGSVSMGSLILSMILLSGYTYPAVAMPAPFQWLSEYIPFTHYAIPLRDVTLLGVGTEYIMPHIKWLSAFVLMEWILILLINQAGIFYNRRKAEGVSDEV